MVEMIRLPRIYRGDIKPFEQYLFLVKTLSPIAKLNPVTFVPRKLFRDNILFPTIYASSNGTVIAPNLGVLICDPDGSTGEKSMLS